MSFLYPYVLLALILPLLLGVGLVVLSHYRKNNWQQLVSAGHRAKLVKPTSVWHSTVPAILLFLAMCSCIIAAARPFNGYRNAEASVNGRNLIIALDISRSMETRDVAPSRLGAARSAAQMLIDALPTDKIGLMIFSGEAELTVPLTYDHAALQEILNRVNRDWESYGGTNLEHVVNIALEDFAQTAPDGTNALVIISDGEDTMDFSSELLSEARKKNLLIITVGVGTQGGGPIPDENSENGLWKDRDNKHVISKLQPQMLNRLAQETNGSYFLMDGSTDIAAFAKAATERLNRHEETFSVNKTPNDMYEYFAGLALLLLLAAIILKTQWKRMPVRPSGSTLLPVVVACLLPQAFGAPDEESVDAYARAAMEQAAGNTEQARVALSEALMDADPRMQAAAMMALGNLSAEDTFADLRKLYAATEEQPAPQPTIEQLEDIIKKLEADRRYFEDALVMQPDLAAAKANCDKLKKLEEAIKQEIERLKQEQNEQNEQDSPQDQQQDGKQDRPQDKQDDQPQDGEQDQPQDQQGDQPQDGEQDRPQDQQGDQQQDGEQDQPQDQQGDQQQDGKQDRPQDQQGDQQQDGKQDRPQDQQGDRKQDGKQDKQGDQQQDAKQDQPQERQGEKEGRPQPQQSESAAARQQRREQQRAYDLLNMNRDEEDEGQSRRLQRHYEYSTGQRRRPNKDY